MTTTDKKEAIIEAAAKRFRYYGISKTTMQEIASDAGMAVGTLYLYFKNKEEIVVACAGKFAEIHRQTFRQILESALPAAEKLKTYMISRFRANQQTWKGSTHNYEITAAVIKLYPERLVEEYKWAFENVLQIVSEGIGKNEFIIEKPEEDVKVFLYAMNFFFPMATNYMVLEPEEEEMLKVMEWFTGKWSVTGL